MNNTVIFNLFRRLYTVVIFLGLPLVNLYQMRRIQKGKEDPQRISERKGITTLPRPQGRIVWIHGASVGEALSVLPVIEHLLEVNPDISVILTTGTVSSAKILQGRLPDRAFHQYTPLDYPGWIKRFLSHWQPAVVIWLESEFWPNTLYAIKQKNIPLILLNGRVSDRSFPRWKNLSSIIGGMLALFDECLAQSDEDARRLSILGARSPVCFGNIKLGAPPLPVDDQSLIEFTQYINDRPLWLLSSSHAGEETIAGEIHTLLSASHKNILSIIVPRHPERGPAIAAEMLARGLTVRLRSENEIPDDKTDIYIADTVGELGLFYRLSDIVVIGKSLLPPGGGQNPYEATQLDNTVLFGPYMSNFSALAINMIAAGVAVQIQQKENLFKELNSLLGDKALLGQRIKSARDFTHGSETVIIDTVAIIRKYL